MKIRIFCLAAALCLLLGGCGWMDGSYVSVEPHEEHIRDEDTTAVSASSYQELRKALEEMVRAGTEQSVISVADYDESRAAGIMKMAVSYILQQDPIGAYAVEDIQFEIGSNAGKTAIAVEISYLRTRTEIQKIRQVAGMDAAWEIIAETLADCDPGVVLLVENYASADITQMVEDYAQEHPETVMEIPQVVSAVYPDSGSTRVLELQFTYQNSRDTLRQMQIQVQRVFSSAALYVNGDDADSQKYSQLYTFLMERFDYQLETSITPAYSLLRHGVGDSRAFAMVYAVMCRQSGLECQIVVGTRSGEPRYWNIVQIDGNYYHVDLLRCSKLGGFRKFTDDNMSGYVWDYSAYPACPDVTPPPATEDTTESVEDTVPDTQPPETVPETTASAETTSSENS